MKYYLSMLFLLLTACGEQIRQIEQVPGPAGPKGEAGPAGSPGAAIVSQSRVATALECPLGAGTAVDFYLDNDASRDVSLGDTLQSGVVACDGQNALASMTVFNFGSNSSCQEIVENELYANKSSLGSNNIRLYFDEIECTNRAGSSNNTGRINELSEGGDEVFYLNDDVLLILEGTNTGSVPLKLRKLTFN